MTSGSLLSFLLLISFTVSNTLNLFGQDRLELSVDVEKNDEAGDGNTAIDRVDSFGGFGYSHSLADLEMPMVYHKEKFETADKLRINADVHEDKTSEALDTTNSPIDRDEFMVPVKIENNENQINLSVNADLKKYTEITSDESSRVSSTVEKKSEAEAIKAQTNIMTENLTLTAIDKTEQSDFIDQDYSEETIELMNNISATKITVHTEELQEALTDESTKESRIMKKNTSTVQKKVNMSTNEIPEETNYLFSGDNEDNMDSGDVGNNSSTNYVKMGEELKEKENDKVEDSELIALSSFAHSFKVNTTSLVLGLLLLGYNLL